MKKILIPMLVLLLTVPLMGQSVRRTLEPEWDEPLCKKVLACAVRDTLALGAKYESFIIWADSSDYRFWIGFSADTADVRIPVTEPFFYTITTDTLVYKTEADSHWLTIIARNRRHR